MRDRERLFLYHIAFTLRTWSRYTYDLPMWHLFTVHVSSFSINAGLAVLMLQHDDICSDLVHMRVWTFHTATLSGLMFWNFHARLLVSCLYVNIIWHSQMKWLLLVDPVHESWKESFVNRAATHWTCGLFHLCCWHNSGSFYPMSARSMWTHSVLSSSDIWMREGKVTRMRHIPWSVSWAQL